MSKIACWFGRHTPEVVGVNDTYHTIDEYKNKTYHQMRFYQCKSCGQRTFWTDFNSLNGIRKHRGIDISKRNWTEAGVVPSDGTYTFDTFPQRGTEYVFPDAAQRVADSQEKIASALEEINTRLAILEPDAKKMKKFPALKEAYDNYQVVKAMVYDAKD